MSLKVPQGGSVLVLQALVDFYLPSEAILHLYKNNYTPISTSVVGDFTEANFDGYAAIPLDTWGAAALNVDNKAQTEEIVRTFTMTGVSTPNTVYGVYITNSGGALLWAEKNPAGGILMNTNGQTYSYLPRFTLVSEF